MAGVPQSSVLRDSPMPVHDPGNAPLLDFIAKSAATIQRTELVVAFLTWVVAAVGLLLGLILVDHWLWPLNEPARYVVWLAFVIGSLFWLATRVLPLLGRRINPEFAAKRIESIFPEMKDGLISWLQLATRDATVSRGVLNAVGRYAFQHLRGQDAAQIVDQFAPIKLMAMLVGFILMGSVYLAVAPKSGSATLYRILMPWAKIAPATRVRILDVSPGNAVVTEGSLLRVAIQVRGWSKTDAAEIVYSTDDGQTLNQIVPMRADLEGLTYIADFGSTFGGIVQPMQYSIRAGDAEAGPYSINVQAVPLVVMDRVEYRYPKYMRMKPRIIEADGAIEGPEGTFVRVQAHANQPARKGRLEFDFKPNAEQGFNVSKASDVRLDDRNIIGEWQLELDERKSNPTVSAYRLRFENSLGETNASPIVYPIKVIPDLSPEIDFVGVAKDEIELPVDQTLKLTLRAIDPDFGLTNISLRATLNGHGASTKELFSDEVGVVGQVLRDYRLDPTALKLRPGHTIEFVGSAQDNRCVGKDEHPDPNVRLSRTIRVTIREPLGKGSAQADNPTTKPDSKSEETPKLDSDQANKADVKKSPSDNAKPSDPTKPGETPSQPDSKPTDSQPDPGESKPSDSAEKPASEPASESGSSPDKSNDKPASSPGSSSESQPSNPAESAGDKSSQGAESPGAASGEQQSAGQPNGAGGEQTSSSGQSGSSGATGDSSSAGSSSSGGPNGKPAANSKPSAASAGDNSTASEGAPDGRASQAGKPDSGATAGSSDPSNGQGTTSTDTSRGQGQKSGRDMHDGEAFERLQEWLEKNQPESMSPSDGAGDGSSKSASPGQTGSKSSASKNADSRPGGESKPSGAKASESSGGQKANSNEAAGADSTSSDKSAESKDASKEGSESGRGSENASSQPSKGGSKGGDAGEQSPGSNSDATSSDSMSSNKAGEKGKSSGSQGKSATDNGNSDSTEKGGKSSESNGESPMNSDPGGEPSGAAESSPNAGGPKSSSAGQSSEGKPGDQGSEKGDASSSTPSESGAGSRSGTAAGDGKSGSSKAGEASPGGNGRSSTEPGAKSSDKASTGPRKSGNPSGQNNSGSNVDDASENANAAESAEKAEAEVEYARQATDMVLKALDRQKNQPDPDLLKRMGWSKEQLQAFIDRWSQTRDSSSDVSEKKREYDEALRSLGLIPNAGRAKASQERNDQLRGMKEEGSRVQPPESIRERFEAFKKSTK